MAPSFRTWLRGLKSNFLGPRRNPPRSVSRSTRAPRLGMESLEDRSVPATHIWTDLGADNNWSTPGNWDAAGVPTTGEPGGTIVQFPTSDPTCNQNIAGLVVDRIDFTSGGNVITLAVPLGLSAAVTSAQLTSPTGVTNTIAGGTLNLPGNLLGIPADLQVNGTGIVMIGSVIAGSNGIRKLGTGTLALTTATGNTYTGTTTIADGTLNLATNTIDAGLSSTIVVGDGAGAAGSAVLQLGANSFEIPDGASVTVASDGQVNVPAGTTEDITTLNVNGGMVNIAATGIFAILAGGTVSSNGATGSQITGAGNLRLNSGTVTFNIANGAAASDLVVSAPITQSGAGTNLIKTGAGTLEFAQVAPGNTYTGTTTIADGTLLLNTITGDDGLSSTVVVGNGTGAAGSAVLRLPHSTEIPDTASVTINSDGLLDVTGTGFEDITTLNVNGGQVAVASGGTLAIVAGGAVTADGTPGSQITGGGNFRLQTGSIPFIVADGSARTDLLVGTPITQVVAGTGLTKAGNGALTLGGWNTYTGATTVNAGTLEVTNAISGPVSLAGGTLAGNGTVGAVTTTGGKIAPGMGDSTQTLSTGNLTLNGSAFAPAISGTASDQLNVTGTVNLNGAALNPTSTGAGVLATASYTLIRNDGTDPITGTFNGLAQGAVVTFGGSPFVLSYAGGDGNDVTLTPPAYTGAFMFGDFLILLSTSFPAGFAFLQLPPGSNALFTDVTGDGYGDVVLFLPTLALAVDGATGRFTLLSSDLNGDGFRELQIFNLDGTTTTIDGKTGTKVTM